MTTEYGFHVDAADTSVAFDCEATRAEREGFTHVAKRQRATALHLRNAVAHMQKLCPEGFRVDTKIVVSLVPDVNAVLRDDVRDKLSA
jgi:methylthioribose-1-phosphate isomerase